MADVRLLGGAVAGPPFPHPITPSYAGELKSAALSLNRQTVEVMAAEDADLEAAFNKLVDQKAAALLVGTDPFLTGVGNA